MPIKKYGILALICLVAASCKKYENGPVISLRTKAHRLKGVWISQHQLLWSGYLPMTGTKSPALIPISEKENESSIIFYSNNEFRCTNFKRFGGDSILYQQSPNFEWHSGIGKWCFTAGIWDSTGRIENLEKKEGLELRFQDGTSVKSKIAKLTHKELWIWIVWEMGPAKMATILYKWEKKE